MISEFYKVGNKMITNYQYIVIINVSSLANK